jgi:hypothetical protein
MRFNHNVLTFTIDENCDLQKKERMALAFGRIEAETDNIINFKKLPIDQEADITVTCNESHQQIKEEFFVAGEGGATSVIKSDLFHIIEQGVVLLYYKRERECIGYNIELHELLHVFGLKHSANEFSIMYPNTQCGQLFTNDIKSELIRLYSVDTLPDLYITNISANRKGKYLNFNAEIKNQGIEVAEDVELVVSSEGEKIKTFDLGDVSYGEGKIISIINMKLPLLYDTDLITFTLETETAELSKNNNEMIMRVA